jgi:hypothetical protein
MVDDCRLTIQLFECGTTYVLLRSSFELVWDDDAV